MAKKQESQEVVETTPPKSTDPEWTDYVLSQLTDKEQENGNPRTDGLRRVAEKLLGPINSETIVVQPPGLDGRATVLVNLTFKENDLARFVSGAADVCFANTAREFAVHSVATAETRAEGRALRKALRLTRVLAAEEAQGASIDEPRGTDDRVVTGMLNSLQMMCSVQQIDLNRLVATRLSLSDPKEMTHKQALEVANILGKFKRKEEEIPNDIRS